MMAKNTELKLPDKKPKKPGNILDEWPFLGHSKEEKDLWKWIGLKLQSSIAQMLLDGSLDPAPEP